MTYVSGLVVVTFRSEVVPSSSRFSWEPNMKALCSLETYVTTTRLWNIYVCTYRNYFDSKRTSITNARALKATEG